MFTLQETDGAQRTWNLTRGETLTIGRLPINRLRVMDLKVSRLHAEVRLIAPNQAVVVNVSSDNTVRVNETYVHPQGGSWPLLPNDEIKIGSMVLRVGWIPEELAPRFTDEPLTMGTTLAPLNSSGIGALISSGRRYADAAPVRDKKLVAEWESITKMLACVCEMSADLLRVDSEQTVLEYATEVVLRVLPVDCCSALLLLKDKDLESVTLRFSNAAAQAQHSAVSRTAVLTAIQEKVVVADHDIQKKSRPRSSDSVSGQGIGALACVPLLGREGVYGALYVDRRLEPKPFSDTDQQMLSVVAGQAAAAIEAVRARAREARAAEAQEVLRRFMPEHLLRELAEHPERYHLGGENKRISVLFSDVRGFSRLAHGMAPEKVVAMLNTLFTEVAAEIIGHSGALNKYLGDGIMALFGAPVSSGNDAFNAVSAAIAMQCAILRVNDKLRARDLPTLSIGIGINTGEATVGIVGAEMRSEYTAIGSAVNIAARVESLTQGGQILITQATADEVRGQFRLQSLGLKELKNIPAPVQVYQVLYDTNADSLPTAEYYLA